MTAENLPPFCLAGAPSPHAIGETIVTWTTPEEMAQGWEVVCQMYPDMSLETYQQRLAEALKRGYRQFACLSSQGRCLGVAGLWLFTRVWCGLQADIDTLVVDRNARSAGIGKRLLAACLEEARTHGARVATLDTYVENIDSHRFYHREGFAIRGYHFVKGLETADSINCHGRSS
ncbi:MAG: GNAT family N-acetyltransferase [Vampirovibrionales bacterium]|nr:GNAT family N-acetyltransferase [Vampirovibrionales bacterium]